MTRFLLLLALLVQAISVKTKTFREEAATQAECSAKWKEVFGDLTPVENPGAPGSHLAWEPEGNRTLLAESDPAGWNNIRMSWELGVCLAYKSRRTYRLNHIPTESYADFRLKFLENGQMRKLNLFDYYDEASFRRVVPVILETDPLPSPATAFFPTKMPVEIPIETYDNETNVVYKSGWGVGSRVFWQYASEKSLQPHALYVNLIQTAFKVRWNILCGAARRLEKAGLTPGDFVAMHRRVWEFKTYGKDLDGRQLKTDPESIVRHIAPIVNGETVLVLTDRRDPELEAMLVSLGGAKRVVCWTGEQREGDDKIFDAEMDMLSAVAAKEFIGSPMSTFTTGIIRWRVQAGTHKIGSPVHFTDNFHYLDNAWNSPGAHGTVLLDVQEASHVERDTAAA
eukprot:TRINITY_DN63888_c0_g1_i1.p1 TRINITY_DN63888_c0_g1~~TRINITY_DN63888_c0_g1_i1.p1  ORF type:complete len:397 (-),score=62.05 TRINITY_DN63888_c0_g1_i1:49-1239(-)